MSRQILDLKAQLLMNTSLGETSEKDKRHAKTERLFRGHTDTWLKALLVNCTRLIRDPAWGEASPHRGLRASTFT